MTERKMLMVTMMLMVWTALYLFTLNYSRS